MHAAPLREMMRILYRVEPLRAAKLGSRRNHKRPACQRPSLALVGKSDLHSKLAIRQTPHALRPGAEPALDLDRFDMTNELGGILAAAHARPPQQPRIRIGIAARHSAQRCFRLDDERPQAIVAEP